MVFEPGTLWNRVVETTRQALQAGALRPIATEFEWIEEAGIPFLVRIVSNLAHKDQLRPLSDSGKSVNPFLPYDPAMYVADASPSHVCLLNKFNVVEHHLLIVTRQFEPQEAPLILEDFAALCNCLSEYEGLAFYNSGSAAGASQMHKHLQIVPLPLAQIASPIPIEPLVDRAILDREIGRISLFRFPHALVRLYPRISERSEEAARQSLELYCAMMEKLGLRCDVVCSGAYNLLMTRRWMLLVPRSRETYRSISLNALAYAGAFLVRNAEQLQVLWQYGPLAALEHAAS